MNRIRAVALSGCAAMLMGALVIVAPGAGAGAATSKGTVNVGIICACTGPLGANYQVGPPAFQAWADGVNANGGINGYKIKVIEKDDVGNPGTSLQDATELINQDHVVAISDDTNDDNTWASLAQSSHVPVIGGGAVSAVPLTNPDFFSNQTTEDVYGLMAVLAAKKVGATKIGDMYCAEAPACSEIVPLEKATAAALGGVSLPYVAEISASAPNYTAECLAAKEAGVTYLQVGESSGAVTRVWQDCVAQGFSPWAAIGDGGIGATSLTTPGVNAKSIGYEVDIPYWLTNTPGTKKYLNLMKKYEPATLKNVNYNEEDVNMYVSGLLFGTALKAGTAGKTGPVTPEEVTAGLYTIHNNTLGGMAPPLTFKAGQTNPIDCWYWVGIKNKKFTMPYGLAPVCQKPPAGT